MNAGKGHIQKNGQDEINLKRSLEYYLRRWKWFALGFLISIFFAFIYLRYATPEFQSTGLIRLITLNNNPTPEEAILGELGLVYGGDKLHTDEIQILKSRSLIEGVVRDLKFNVQVFSEGSIKDKELYKTSPIKVYLLSSDSILYDYSDYFEITIVSDSEFMFTDEYGVESKKVFGANILTDAGSMVISPSDTFNPERDLNKKLKIVISPIEEIADFYRDKLSVYSFNDRVNRSNMIGVTITDPVARKAADFVNGLIDTYNQRYIENKEEIAKTTYDFINERVARIAGELSEIDSTKEGFKVGNMLTDVNAEAGMYVQAEAVNETELIKVSTELSTVNYMLNYLRRNSDESYKTLPTNLGLNDPTIGDITSQFNQLLMERDRILTSSGNKNPVVLQFNERLAGLHNSLIQSLESLRSALSIKQANYLSQSEMINSRIASVPGQERENRVIQRQQDIKESIYLYLLQKREESAISMQTSYPNAEVIDRAKVNEKYPVYPKRKLVILAAGIVGLLIPFIYFFAGNFLNTKITALRDLGELKGLAPVVGELPRVKDLDELTSYGDQFSESMRVLRTNLDFTGKTEGTGTKVIFVSSTINGEGKTFMAYNLARVYAYSNKRVLLIGADIRKPNLHEYIRFRENRGFSDYLNDHVDLKDIIMKAGDDSNLYVLHSGSIPPNPAELLLSSKVASLFHEVKQEFDVIIVDTAPTMLVTDTMLIGKYADQVLYIVRAGYTDKELLSHIGSLIEEQKLTNIHIALNDVRAENLMYGGKYESNYSYSLNGLLPWYKKLWARIAP